MSTPLHKRMLSFNHAEDERGELMRKVWSGHPWMVDAFGGDYEREREILEWCYANFGEQASPIYDKPGTWLRGGATVNGWTWFGFSTEADMQKFREQWTTRGDLP